MLALDGGSAHFVHAPSQGGDLLVDCGNESAAGFIVKPFLRGQGVNRLPHFLVTHGDARHVAGWRTVWDEFQPRAVGLSVASFRSPEYRRLGEMLDAAAHDRTRLRRGDTIAGWTVLHPAAEDNFALADDAALVLRGTFSGVRVLLLSDLGQAGQRALVERGGELQADIVVAGLPARGEPLGAALLAAVQPQVIILSDAARLTAERASDASCARLAKSGARLLRTSQNDSLTIRLRSGRWEIRDMHGGRWRGETAAAITASAPDDQAGLGASWPADVVPAAASSVAGLNGSRSSP